MAISFKQFLAEGGKATEKFNVERASKADIEKALEIVSKTLGVDVRDNLLGSTRLTLAGKKQDSGDVDIALTTDEIKPEEADQKMLELTGGEGSMNKGTNIGSYAVDVGGKKIQVDLMFVDSKDWAKFIFHSAQGENSAYPGAVRNLLLMVVTRHTHEMGKDFLIKMNDKVVARASRALKLDVGLERLFKFAKKGRDGKLNPNNMEKMDPAELKKQAEALAGKEIKFSPDAEVVNAPDAVAQWLFGQGVAAKDIMTAEQVCELIKKRKDAQTIIADAKKSLKDANLPIPKELG